MGALVASIDAVRERRGVPGRAANDNGGGGIIAQGDATGSGNTAGGNTGGADCSPSTLCAP